MLYFLFCAVIGAIVVSLVLYFLYAAGLFFILVVDGDVTEDPVYYIIVGLFGIIVSSFILMILGAIGHELISAIFGVK